jgi:hypothetical protein
MFLALHAIWLFIHNYCVSIGGPKLIFFWMGCAFMVCRPPVYSLELPSDKTNEALANQSLVAATPDKTEWSPMSI